MQSSGTVYRTQVSHPAAIPQAAAPMRKPNTVEDDTVLDILPELPEQEVLPAAAPEAPLESEEITTVPQPEPAREEPEQQSMQALSALPQQPIRDSRRRCFRPKRNR